VSEQLRISEEGAAALQRSRGEAFDVARARVLDPNSPNTQRAYKNAFKLWCAYCDALGLAWAPIEAPELVTYLEQLSQRCAQHRAPAPRGAVRARRREPRDPDGPEPGLSPNAPSGATVGALVVAR